MEFGLGLKPLMRTQAPHARIQSAQIKPAPKDRMPRPSKIYWCASYSCLPHLISAIAMLPGRLMTLSFGAQLTFQSACQSAFEYDFAVQRGGLSVRLALTSGPVTPVMKRQCFLHLCGERLSGTSWCGNAVLALRERVFGGFSLAGLCKRRGPDRVRRVRTPWPGSPLATDTVAKPLPGLADSKAQFSVYDRVDAERAPR